MGIADLRLELADVPGAHNLTMRYEDGGKVQVFMMNDIEAKVSPTATTQEIRKALLEASAALEWHEPGTADQNGVPVASEDE